MLSSKFIKVLPLKCSITLMKKHCYCFLMCFVLFISILFIAELLCGCCPSTKKEKSHFWIFDLEEICRVDEEKEQQKHDGK